STLQTLERLQYLEQYLWPHYKSEPSEAVLASILLVLNEKYRKGLLRLWAFVGDQGSFSQFFDDAIRLMQRAMANTGIRFGEQTIDPWSARSLVAQFLIACFNSLENQIVRDSCMALVSILIWHHIEGERLRTVEFERTPQLHKLFKHLTKKCKSGDAASVHQRNRDFLPQVVSDFANSLFDPDSPLFYCLKCLEFLVDLESQLPTRRYVHLVVVDFHLVQLCEKSRWAGTKEFDRMVGRLRHVVYFQVRNVTGQAMSDSEAKEHHYEKLIDLQLVVFKHFPEELEALVLSSVAQLGNPQVLTMFLDKLSDTQLEELAQLTGIRTRKLAPPSCNARAFVLEAFAQRYMERATVADQVRALSMYPTEHVLDLVEEINVGKHPAIPKLNLQFLSMHDYLLRCLELVRLESAFEIREDILDCVRRLQPHGDPVEFSGWARMAMPMRSFDIVDVQKPRVGELAPHRVRADIAIGLEDYVESIRQEWRDVRPRDVLILLSIRGNTVQYVRGCEVESQLDIGPGGDTCSGFRVLLDTHQYHRDLSTDVYDSLNIVMRRRPQENSFKATLETIRSLVLKPTLPSWLQATFLGYGDPAAATPIGKRGVRVNLNDTFVSDEHMRECLGSGVEGEFAKPCIVDIPANGPVCVSTAPAAVGPGEELRQPRMNHMRFTPKQAEAICAGCQPGLTLIVGPPGTGKTDVAVQIISNLYHTGQKILLVTHSNQALNQLFEKIVNLDIEPRHLLRLGHGEEALMADERYSRAGRVESFLERRRELLGEVQRLAESMGIEGDFGYTCSTARVFFVSCVRVRWEAYRKAPVCFPFLRFFEDKLGHPPKDHEACFRYIERIFSELNDIQPFELLRTQTDRSSYLLANQARVVAMTCTYGALRYEELQAVGFDSVVVEEAAQLLDIETTIPVVCARPQRLVMIGDHRQLPPVVKSSALRVVGNLEQSLFARLVRLGVPTVQLDRQGRARPELASLWRPEGLGDLPIDFGVGNKGFRHVFQFVDVSDPVGETQPLPHFYQNLREAEYVVAVFQYMRLLGHQSVKILTTYNGQAMLIRDVLRRHGLPSAVATVDQFQGQQADYVLLSLVRTKTAGHIRDPRRLTVALSRSRLGLYVFGRRRVFETCVEMQQPMQMLLAHGDRLEL
ncbi:P-loop containing nucleoside triphosphate hydrolase protein, partial [Coemansia spiralis]